jgi:predicted dinucleotide-binding enzyme
MTIGIIGAGLIGGAFARRLAHANLPAILSNNRRPDSLADLVADIGGPAALLAEDPRAAGGRRVLFFGGSDAPAKAEVADLIERLGFYGIDLGLLNEGGRAMSVPGGALTIQNLVRLD